MPRFAAAPRLVIASLLLATAACAPTHEWVNPMLPMANRSLDMRDCRYEADFQARRHSWMQRDMAMREYFWARSPGQRAMANARMHQLEMLEQMDRNRFFDRCMEIRGYALRPIDGR
jgi:hypothetical protein